MGVELELAAAATDSQRPYGDVMDAQSGF